MLEVTKCAPQMAIKDLGKAFTNFFSHAAGYPRFKKKGAHDSFGISNDHFSVKGKKLRIPKHAPIRMMEERRCDGKILSAVISREADRWFIRIAREVEDCPETANAATRASAQ